MAQYCILQVQRIPSLLGRLIFYLTFQIITNSDDIKRTLRLHFCIQVLS